MRIDYRFRGKRALDLLGGTVAAIALAPVAAAVALAVWWRLGSPVLFRQERAGKHGRPFTLYKFRTMLDLVDSDGNLLPDDERLPPFGGFLRASSLDELPQLWNVLRGDMSLVGPRPLYVRYVTRYTPLQRRRLDVKPGMTGWAQINGRNTPTWDAKHALDVWYVDNLSFRLDIRILLHTLTAVLRRRGITHPGHPAMPEFLGTTSRALDSNCGSGPHASRTDERQATQ